MREASPGVGLYSRDDLNRLKLCLNGILDPIRRSDGMKTFGVTKTMLRLWSRSGRLKLVATTPREVWCSRATLRRLAEERRRQKRAYDTGLREGRLMRIKVAAKHLGVSATKLSKAFKAESLKPVRFDLIHRTCVERAAVARAKRRRTLTRRNLGLPPGLIGAREAALLLAVSQRTVGKLVARGKLRCAARGRGALLAFKRGEVMRLKRESETNAQLRTGLLSTADVAERLDVGINNVHRLVAEGQLQAKAVGAKGAFLYRRSEVEKLARARGT